MTLNDLRSRLDSFEPGDWFELNGKTAGWGGQKNRPFMLVENRPHPISLVCPRTTTGRTGKYHQPHPYRHAPKCQIDKAGWVGKERLQIKTALLSRGTYRCSEPDKVFLDSILPEHLK